MHAPIYNFNVRRYMESENLRIGNFVYVKNEIITVKSIHDDGINQDIQSSYYGSFETDYEGYFYNYDKRVIGPIPLSEEWILKFGFNKHIHEDNLYVEYEKNSRCIKKDGQEFWWLTNDAFNDVQLFYVHELQNLYYALTREELELV